MALSFDQSFWGESSGSPRGAVLPDVYTENFSTAVDFLGTRDFVSRDSIGVIGICASGAFSLAAAKIVPRIKAVATHAGKRSRRVTAAGIARWAYRMTQPPAKVRLLTRHVINRHGVTPNGDTPCLMEAAKIEPADRHPVMNAQYFTEYKS